MRSRGRTAWAIVWLLAAGVPLTVSAASAQSGDALPESRFVEHRERFTPEGGTPIDLRFLIAREAAGQTGRVVNATHAALTLLSGWFGPVSPSLTVTGAPWRASFIGTSTPGLVAIPLRWLAPVRDQSMERAVVAAIVRQYWAQSSSRSAFEEGVAIYAGVRAIHQLLEGSHFETPRFFGGAVPFPLRSVLLSPPVGDPRPRVWAFEELVPPAGPGDEVRRAVQALQTLERYVGWPTLLETLTLMRTSPAGRHDAEAFATALSDARGTDMRALVMECLRADAVFDYSLDSLQSQPGPQGLFETTLTITRRGSGVFEIGDAAGDREQSMPLAVRFSDGTQVRDFFDGQAPSATMVYTAKSTAAGATVDPDVMLLLDVNRENNAIARDAATAPLGVRLALHWMTWLQNAMLSYTALL